MRLTQIFALLALLALPAPAQQGTDSPAAALERGHYAEEHERDFEAAAAWYQTALTLAMQLDDAARAEEARAALERLKQRRGEAPPPQDEEAVAAEIEQRMGAVLRDLGNRAYTLRSQGTPLGAFIPASTEAAGELDLFGQRSARLLESFFEQRTQRVGNETVTLEKEDVARVLARMRTAEADAALERGARSANPLVRREVMRAADPARHRAVLLVGAADPVPAVREAAVAGLAQAPRPGDAELLRGAFEGGIEAALAGLYKLDSEAVVARALQPDASEALRERTFSLLQEEPGAPSAAKLELALRRALEAPTKKERERPLTWLRDTLQQSWSPLPEPLRARAETSLLEQLEALPTSWTVATLFEVAGARTFDTLPRRMIESAAVYEAVGEGEALPQLFQDLQLEEASVVARIANALPALDSVQGAARERALGTILGLHQTLQRLPWPLDDPAPLLQTWRALDPALQPRFVSMLAGWTRSFVERRAPRFEGSADLAFRPGSLDASFLPLGHALIDWSSQTTSDGLLLLRGVGGDSALLAHLALDLAGGKSSSVARRGIEPLVAQDPAAARAAIVEAIRSGWQLRPELPPLSVAALDFLPDDEAVAAFRALWQEMEAGDPRRTELLRRLTRTERSDATALLVEHYGAIPQEDADLRQDVLNRVRQQLYEPGIELLDQALRDRDERVRGMASAVFGAFRAHRETLDKFEAWKRGDEARRDAATELRELLASESREVRLGAVASLGALRAKEALPDLVRLLAQEDEELRAAVRAAIARMTEEERDGADEGAGG